jgi:hypothetical protein
MSAHTPRPWEASRAANSIGQRHIYDASNNPVAKTVYHDVEHPERIAANAHLIAASPDLYAALDALVGYVDDNPPACVRGLLNDALAALSKAEGK